MADTTPLYEGQDINVSVDKTDDEYPFKVEVGSDWDWLSADDASEAAKAILGYLKPAVSDDTLIRASEISFNEGVLRLAAVHGKTVTFRYAKGDGKAIETRSLVPAEVKKVGDHLTFVGYDPDRDDVRAYRVDRMKGEVTVA